MTARHGDLVTVAGGEGGRVTAIAGKNVEVELTNRPGLRFWYKAQDVRAGTPPPKPTMMAARYSKGHAVEVRPVCKHLNLAEACLECGTGTRASTMEAIQKA